MRLPREFYIPKHASKVTPKGINAVIYAYEAAGKCYAMGFAGKAEKPTFHLCFRSAERRAEYVSQWIDGLKASADYKAKRKAEKLAFSHTLKTGDILRCSWGYDQTNIDFYEVTKVIGKHVEIRGICQERETTGWEQGKGIPLPGQFTDKPAMRKLVQQGNSVRIASYACAYPVEMKEVAPGVKVCEASHWTSYA